ncbi:hypothetical protein D3C87_1774420 [compost metagenome]
MLAAGEEAGEGLGASGVTGLGMGVAGEGKAIGVGVAKVPSKEARGEGTLKGGGVAGCSWAMPPGSWPAIVAGALGSSVQPAEAASSAIERAGAERRWLKRFTRPLYPPDPVATWPVGPARGARTV